MWMVQRLTDGELIVLTLCGRIRADELGALQEHLATEAKENEIAMDLKEVKLVDQETVAFLAYCEATGTELRNCPAYIREWINRMNTQPSEIRLRASVSRAEFRS